jgi:hypothetical protein
MSTIRGKGQPTGFKMIPEGEHVMHVTNVKGIPRTNVSTVTMEMVNAEGLGFNGKWPQKYDLNSDGGYGAFYYLLKNGYGIVLDDGDEFDLGQLEDTYVTVEIIHKEGTKARDDGTFPIFANIKATIGPGEPFAAGVGNEADPDTDDEDDEDDD